jgi:zinc D-Ala-D-Ala dipeptidase
MNLKSMLKLFFFLLINILLFSCIENSPSPKKRKTNNVISELPIVTIDTITKIKPEKTIRKEIIAKEIDSLLKLEFNAISYGLIDVQMLDPTIKIDLKYATTDNFMHQKVYASISKAYFQNDVAQRIVKCQEYLKSIDPNLSLLIYDAVRPLSVQKIMWRLLDTIPVKDRTKFVSNPANGSVHNYGAAVDLTICDLNGVAIDMGAGYDDIRKIAYPRLEGQFLASGDLTQEQIDNRKLLRKVLATQGFSNIPTEWWHFNACSRNTAKSKYKLVL